jgi:hypothetical protein
VPDMTFLCVTSWATAIVPTWGMMNCGRV